MYPSGIINVQWAIHQGINWGRDIFEAQELDINAESYWIDTITIMIFYVIWKKEMLS